MSWRREERKKIEWKIRRRRISRLNMEKKAEVTKEEERKKKERFGNHFFRES
jgi:hypothetical protein